VLQPILENKGWFRNLTAFLQHENKKTKN
jgi:hypothetical protein